MHGSKWVEEGSVSSDRIVIKHGVEKTHIFGREFGDSCIQIWHCKGSRTACILRVFAGRRCPVTEENGKLEIVAAKKKEAFALATQDASERLSMKVSSTLKIRNEDKYAVHG